MERLVGEGLVGDGFAGDSVAGSSKSFGWLRVATMLATASKLYLRCGELCWSWRI